MGSLIGHVAPGFAFLLIGFWHILNHIKLHSLNPKTYTSFPWFPTSRFKYLELFFIIFGGLAFISMELFIGPDRHQPLDPDFTIPYHHLRNFDHSNISISFLIYAIFSIILDKIQTPSQYGLSQILASIAFAQQLLLFHVHAVDHTGVEGQYHWLLQVVIFVSLFTTLLGLGYKKSFLISFIRSFSIILQGVWFIAMGIMLYTKEFMPKGCFINIEDDHQVVRCHDQESLMRAKSLVNLLFSWLLIVLTICVMLIYLFLIKNYHQKVCHYQSLNKFQEVEDEEQEDLEAQKKTKSFLG